MSSGSNIVWGKAGSRMTRSSGRILLRREPYAIDIERVMQSFPDRLDLSDRQCRMATDFGVKLVISTDSHATSHLDLMRYGVATARRGWIEPTHVLNTRDCDSFLDLLHDGHRQVTCGDDHSAHGKRFLSNLLTRIDGNKHVEMRHSLKRRKAGSTALPCSTWHGVCYFFCSSHLVP